MISVIRALAVGVIGGTLAFLIGVPAPWLAGSLIATIIAIYSSQNLELPDWLRTLAFILLGIQTGTAVNADTLSRAAQWPLSILCMGVTVMIIVWACILYYERLRKWDRATAYFSSLPGALSMVILLAGSSGADMQRVTISQSVRLFFPDCRLAGGHCFLLSRRGRGKGDTGGWQRFRDNRPRFGFGGHGTAV
jgi:membrane AbrB-like protein